MYVYFFDRIYGMFRIFFCHSSLRNGGLNGKKSNPPSGEGKKSWVPEEYADPPSL
jgi:hypothetical protein